MPFDLKDLRCFVAVAEEGHVTRAAERLGMEQPPLSMRIKALERRLAVQLFVRKPRGMELTAAGKTFLLEAQGLLGRLEHSVQVTRSAARGEIGHLRIAIAPTAPLLPFVPRCIRAFRAAFPEVGVTIGEGLSNEVKGQLVDQQMDVAFVRMKALGDERLSVIPILEEPLIAALPRSHMLARGRRKPIPSLAALEHDAFVLIGPAGTGLHDQTIAACAAAGFSPSIGQLAPRITSTLGFVAAGMGVALVPASLRHLSLDGVVYRDFAEPLKSKAFLGLASRSHDRSPVVRNFLRHVKECASQGA